jgi:hypothetical protein
MQNLFPDIVAQPVFESWIPREAMLFVCKDEPEWLLPMGSAKLHTLFLACQKEAFLNYS